MFDPYSRFPSSREPLFRSQTGFGAPIVPTQGTMPTPVAPPMIPISPGGVAPGQPITEYFQLPGDRPSPPHVHGAPIPGVPPAQTVPPNNSGFPTPNHNSPPYKEDAKSPTTTWDTPGYKKGWDVNGTVHTVFPDGTQHQKPITGIAPIVIPEAPYFAVPTNPLLPSDYREVLTYEGMQYLNGFLRTQIGKFCYVEFLFGSSGLATRYGVLAGVGINYILLENPSSHELTIADFYSIRYVDVVNVENYCNLFSPSE